MKVTRWAALCIVLVAAVAAAADSCLKFEVDRNYNFDSKTGVQAEVRVTNNCAADLRGNAVWFTVTAFDSGHHALGAQTGHFDGTVEKSSESKTWVFVSCDPEKVEKLEVVEGQ